MGFLTECEASNHLFASFIMKLVLGISQQKGRMNPDKFLSH